MTHYVDASFVYGSSPATTVGLREMRGGRLRAQVIDGEEFLPGLQAGQEVAMPHLDRISILYYQPQNNCPTPRSRLSVPHIWLWQEFLFWSIVLLIGGLISMRILSRVIILIHYIRHVR